MLVLTSRPLGSAESRSDGDVDVGRQDAHPEPEIIPDPRVGVGVCEGVFVFVFEGGPRERVPSPVLGKRGQLPL